MVIKKTVYKGLRNAAKVIIELAKVLLPVTIFVTLLEYSGWLNLIATFFSPLMNTFGLPGETALAFVIGNLASMYGGVAVLVTLDLTAKQITIFGTMLLLCHSLLTETVIVAKVGGKPLPVAVSRISSSLAVGFLLNQIL